MNPTAIGLANAAGSRGQEMLAASAICQISPARSPARTRLYRDRMLGLEGFPLADSIDHLADESVTIWLDLRDPGHHLAVISKEFGLHPLAVQAALHRSHRPQRHGRHGTCPEISRERP